MNEVRKLQKKWCPSGSTLSLNIFHDWTYMYELSAIALVILNKGEGYGKDKIMNEEAMASNNEFSWSIGSYRIHIMGL